MLPSGALFCWFLAAAADPPVAASPPAPPPPPLPPALTSPFRLAMTYTHVLGEDGDLVTNHPTTNALGVDLVSPSSSYARTHFGVAYQWESAGPYSARGFRVDLISVGYPIRVVDAPASQFRLDVEPILTLLRGEIMFVTGGKFLRVESGVGVDLSATYRRWFLSVQPLAVDFRYWVYASSAPASQTGLGRILPFRLALGHEF